MECTDETVFTFARIPYQKKPYQLHKGPRFIDKTLSRVKREPALPVPAPPPYCIVYCDINPLLTDAAD